MGLIVDHSDFLTQPLFRTPGALPPKPSPLEQRENALKGSAIDKSEFTRHVPIHVDQFQLGLENITGLIERAGRTNTPGGTYIFGEGGVGKSFIFDAIMAAYPAYETETSYICPVIKLIFDSRVDEAPFYSMLLLKLGCDINFIAKLTVAELKSSFISAARASGLRLIAFDEAHHMWGITPSSRGKPSMGGRLGNSIKRTYDDTGVAFVFAAIPELKPLVDKDRQSNTRWTGDLVLAPFSDLTKFRGVLMALDQAIPLLEPSNLAEEGLAVEILTACKGYFRPLKSLLAEAVYLAAIDNAPCLNREHLRRAYRALYCALETPFDV